MAVSMFSKPLPPRPRGREADLLAESLRSSRLTTLYGAAGSGKTGLLHDGVMPLLHRRASDSLVPQGLLPRGVLAFPDRRRNPSRRRSPEVAVSFHGWDAAATSPVSRLLVQLHAALGIAAPDIEPGVASGADAGANEAGFNASLPERLAALESRFGARFLVILDGFERCLVPADDRPELRDFQNQLIATLHRPLPANFLISLDERAQPQFERLLSHLPGLGDNTLHLGADDDTAFTAWRPAPPLRQVPPAGDARRRPERAAFTVPGAAAPSSVRAASTPPTRPGPPGRPAPSAQGGGDGDAQWLSSIGAAMERVAAAARQGVRAAPPERLSIEAPRAEAGPAAGSDGPTIPATPASSRPEPALSVDAQPAPPQLPQHSAPGLLPAPDPAQPTDRERVREPEATAAAAPTAGAAASPALNREAPVVPVETRPEPAAALEPGVALKPAAAPEPGVTLEPAAALEPGVALEAEVALEADVAPAAPTPLTLTPGVDFIHAAEPAFATWAVPEETQSAVAEVARQMPTATDADSPTPTASNAEEVPGPLAAASTPPTVDAARFAMPAPPPAWPEDEVGDHPAHAGSAASPAAIESIEPSGRGEHAMMESRPDATSPADELAPQVRVLELGVETSASVSTSTSTSTSASASASASPSTPTPTPTPTLTPTATATATLTPAATPTPAAIASVPATADPVAVAVAQAPALPTPTPTLALPPPSDSQPSSSPLSTPDRPARRRSAVPALALTVVAAVVVVGGYAGWTALQRSAPADVSVARAPRAVATAPSPRPLPLPPKTATPSVAQPNVVAVAPAAPARVPSFPPSHGLDERSQNLVELASALGPTAIAGPSAVNATAVGRSAAAGALPGTATAATRVTPSDTVNTAVRATAWPAGFDPVPGQPGLAVARYDALQAARPVSGDRPPFQVVAPLFTETVSFVARADSPLAFVHQIDGARLGLAAVGDSGRLTAQSLYQRLFGKPLPASAATPPLSADAALGRLLRADGIDVLMFATPRFAEAWAGLPAATARALKPLARDPSQPADQRALQAYLPALAAPGVDGAPGYAVVSFLVAADAATASNAAQALCAALPALRRGGNAAWRELRPGLEFATGWPTAPEARRRWRECSTPSG